MCYFTRRDLEGHFEVRLLGLGGGYSFHLLHGCRTVLGIAKGTCSVENYLFEAGDARRS